jgi:hypothetical protein
MQAILMASSQSFSDRFVIVNAGIYKPRILCSDSTLFDDIVQAALPRSLLSLSITFSTDDCAGFAPLIAFVTSFSDDNAPNYYSHSLRFDFR